MSKYKEFRNLVNFFKNKGYKVKVESKRNRFLNNKIRLFAKVFADKFYLIFSNESIFHIIIYGKGGAILKDLPNYEQRAMINELIDFVEKDNDDYAYLIKGYKELENFLKQ